MKIRITNLTGGTIFRENAFIELPDGFEMPPQSIVHEPSTEGHSSQIRPGDTIVLTYEMMFLSEQLIQRYGYRGKAKVKFVFADSEKRHEKWIRIKPNLETWARDVIVQEARGE
jgi:hypothetical protein